MSDPLTTTEGLKPGDVCVVAVKMRDRTTGKDYWWKRFVVVLSTDFGFFCDDSFHALTLKMRPEEKDRREVHLGHDVVTKLDEDQWPQGVVAMRMKAIMTGWIKLGDNPGP